MALPRLCNWMFVFIIIIIGSMFVCSVSGESSREFVLIVDHRPNYEFDARNYSLTLESHKPGRFWSGSFCKTISSENEETLTYTCEFFKPLVFVKTDANGEQTEVVTNYIEYRGSPKKIKIPEQPKIWDGRRSEGHDAALRAFMDKFFSEEEPMAREESFRKKLQFAKLEYRTLAELHGEQMPSDMYLEHESYL